MSFTVNGITCSDTPPEQSYSPNLSTPSLSASNSHAASPSDAPKLATSTDESLLVSSGTGQLPAVTVTSSASSVVAEEPFRFETTSLSTDDDLFYDKKKDAQDIVSALQGSFDFLQDSEIDKDSKWSLPLAFEVVLT